MPVSTKTNKQTKDQVNRNQLKKSPHKRVEKATREPSQINLKYLHALGKTNNN